jgi:magnesium transporter
VGIVTVDDAIDVLQSENTEDIAKMAAVTPTDKPYLKTSVWRIGLNRFPWLLILLGLGLLVSSVINKFIAIVPPGLVILYSFQSLILGMSGNSGTQSLAVTIRLISDDTLSTKEKFKFVFKEIRVGACNGLIIGLIAFIFIGLYVQFLEPTFVATFNVSGFAVSACIGISLFVSMVVASLDGTLIPIVFKKIGIDPAVASGPLITTINDLLSVFVYYGASILLLVNLLGLA